MKLNYIYITTLLFFTLRIEAQIDAFSILGLPVASNNTEMNGITGAQEGSVLYNIAQKNIYFFNGSNWVTPSSSSTNIYSNDGVLSSSRTVNGGGNSITFNNLNNFQIFSNNASQLFSIGALQLGSTGNNTQISGALGLTLTAISNGITLNGNTSINNNLSLTGSFADSSALTGTSGQVLTSTVTGTQWKDIKLAEVVSKTSNYTLTVNDNGKVFTFNSSTDVTLTVPNGLPIGFNISIYQTNTGKVTIVGSGGTTILNRLSRFQTAGKDAGAGLICTNTNNFHLTGDLKR